MKRLLAVLCAVFVMGAAAQFARADVAIPPVPKPKGEGAVAPHLTVMVDPAAKTSRVILPAVANAAEGPAVEEAGPAAARTQTMVIGGAMALAITFGGLWFFRGRNKNRGGMAVILLLAMGVMGVSTVTAFADMPGPGPRPHRPLPPIAPPVAPGPVTGEDKSVTLADGLDVTVEQGKDHDVVVRLTSADAAKLAAALKANAAILPAVDKAP